MVDSAYSDPGPAASRRPASPLVKGMLALAAALFVATCASAVYSYVQAMGAVLCQGQSPGVCEAAEGDANRWWLITGILFAVFFVSVLCAAFTSGREMRRR